MGVAIFDKNSPVLTGLTQSFTRNTASVDGVGDAVAADEIRHAPPTKLASLGTSTTALTGSYRVIGGNEVFVARNSGDNTYRILRANSDGSVTNLNTISETSLTGFNSITTALGAAATSEGFTNTETTNNYTVGTIRAANYAYGLLRIYTEIRKWNGSAWQAAQYAMWWSIDNGDTWNFEYRTADDDIGTERGQPWCLNPWPTTLYRRGSAPLVVAYAEADYLSKAGSPTTGRFTLSVFSRGNTTGAPWSHLGHLEVGTITGTDHGHTAVVLEHTVSGRDQAQLIAVCGDGSGNNVMRRWIFDDGGNLDPDIPSSFEGFFTPGNWTLDATWQHGDTTEEFGNQVTSAFQSDVEGEFLALYDNDSGVFGRIVPGPTGAIGPSHTTLGPKSSTGSNIALYSSTDGTGRIAMTMWEDSSREPDGTMVDDNLSSISTAPGAARIMYSSDYGNTWSALAIPDNTDCGVAVASGRVFWSEGSSNVQSKPIPPLRALRPASVSPGATGYIYSHLGFDGVDTVDWSKTGTLNGGVTLQIITKAGGVFTDPDTSEVIPNPPCITDWIMKMTILNRAGQTIGNPEWGERNSTGSTIAVGQADWRVWMMPAGNEQGCNLGWSYKHQVGTNVTGFAGGGPRTYSKMHDRNGWYPIYDAGTVWPGIPNTGHAFSGNLIADGATPPDQSLYLVPDIAVIGGGGKIGQPLPKGASSSKGTAPDEVLELTGMSFRGTDDNDRSLRVVCRIPWDSWHEFADHSGSSAGCGTKTLWRLYRDVNNWVVCEWDGANHRIQYRFQTSAVSRPTVVVHDGALAAMRETVIDSALVWNGSTGAVEVSCSVDGKVDSGSSAGAAFPAALTSWRAGADESGALTAVEVIAVETFSDTLDPVTMLGSLPGSSLGGLNVAAIWYATNM